MQLTGSYYSESNYDYIYIYNGVGTGGTLLYSGSASSSTSIGTITSTDPTGALTIRFTSDGSVQNSGFDFTISCFGPALPGENCSNAQNLATLTSPYSASTTGYADDISTCRTGYPDRMFYLDVPNNYSVDIWQSTNDYDSYHYMGYGASCPGTQIYCVDDADTQNNPWVNTTGTTQRVWFIVDGYSGSGNFTLNWNLVAACNAPYIHYGKCIKCNSLSWRKCYLSIFHEQWRLLLRSKYLGISVGKHLWWRCEIMEYYC